MRWKGEPLSGDRPAALLAALALYPTGLSDGALAEQVWTDRLPDHPAKALQVVVSRVRNSCGAELIKRYDGGYRLALPRTAVDTWAAEDLVTAARSDLAAGQLTRARSAVEAALSLLNILSAGGTETGPLMDVRHAALRLRRSAEVMLGLALSGTGEDAAALPYLLSAHRAAPDDETVLAALLKSESKAIGPAAALSRYEDYRAGLRDRLGTDPGEGLRRIHRELLAADHPLHTGLHFDGTELLGRDEDLRQLQTLVRTGRVTSILGPGGLGKTRLAHVLARDAVQSRVHFVELVGVTSPDDVVAEVGAALGVRDSVAGRRDLTAAQRADIRGRIAQQLDMAPTLLVLDNCEHLVEAVASLVAFLVVTTRELHVVTTTRSPLNIAAERVFLLGQLGERDSAELFCRRATAARPDVRLDDEAVASVVRRLDGLPLAIELAAARTRVMSVDEISRRLQDRFALLRGRDHTAPDRHQTLQAVIDWSWNLLGPVDQKALCWLSVFHDGFGMAGAERLIGDQAMTSVENLVDQSLLTVSESEGRVRYRMLETVREFGRMHLDLRGERESASTAQTAWAVELCSDLVPRVYGPDQIEVIDEIRNEEANLADVLRQRLAANDSPAAAVVMSALGIYWSISGNHGRIIVLADAAQDALCDWDPDGEDQVEYARLALALLISNTGLAFGRDITQLSDALRRLGPGEDPFVVAAYSLHLDGAKGFPPTAALEELKLHPDRRVRIIAKMWACVLIENDGNPEAARVHALEAIELCRDSDGPWQLALLQNQLAGLELQLGNHAGAAELARRALPDLLRLNAMDDAMHMSSALALDAIAEGRLDDAEGILRGITRSEDQSAVISGRAIVVASYAELSLARGDLERGLQQYDEAVEAMRDIHFPGMETSGLEPWTIFIESISVVAVARHATSPEVVAAAKARRDDVLDRASRLLVEMPAYVDYPVTGLALVAVAVWGILRGTPGPEESIRLLVLGKRFAYNQSLPTVAWDRLVAEADAIRPGLVAELLDEYGDRTGPDLVKDALKMFERA